MSREQRYLAYKVRVRARVVYKIPYRRARAWPLGRVRRASKGILHTRLGLGLGLHTICPIVARAWPSSSGYGLSDECARVQRYLAYKGTG